MLRYIKAIGTPFEISDKASQVHFHPEGDIFVLVEEEIWIWKKKISSRLGHLPEFQYKAQLNGLSLQGADTLWYGVGTKVYRWNWSLGEPEEFAEFPGLVFCTEVSFDNRYLAVSGIFRGVKVWDLQFPDNPPKVIRYHPISQ